MIVVLIILAIIVFILVVPLGATVTYLDGALGLAARFLCFDITLLPGKDKPEKEKKPKKVKEKKKEEPDEKKPKEKKKLALTPELIIEALHILTETLARFRRKLTVNNFMLHFIAAADDPYDAAMMYGYVNTALGVLYGKSSQLFNVRRSDVQTAVDFESTEPKADFAMTVTISLGRILAVALWAGFKLLKLKKQMTINEDRDENAEERTDKDGSAASAAERNVGDAQGQHGEDQGDGGC